MVPPESGFLRPIRSFVRREGRMTPAQERALTELLPRYGIAGDGPIDFVAEFARAAPVHLEIGFGNGDALAAMAALHPENHYVGIEVHRPGVGHLLRRVASEAIANVRVVNADATAVLAQRIQDAALAAIYIFFPDPWPKKRHHKRRLVQPEFVALLARKLAPGGLLRFATDWQHYAGHALAVLDAEPGLENTSGRGQYAPRFTERPRTRFENRGARLGHGVWDLAYRRIAGG
jgi:tRNA (guanine-N7-)-methyltransferase